MNTFTSLLTGLVIITTVPYAQSSQFGELASPRHPASPTGCKIGLTFDEHGKLRPFVSKSIPIHQSLKGIEENFLSPDSPALNSHESHGGSFDGSSSISHKKEILKAPCRHVTLDNLTIKRRNSLSDSVRRTHSEDDLDTALPSPRHDEHVASTAHNDAH